MSGEKVTMRSPQTILFYNVLEISYVSFNNGNSTDVIDFVTFNHDMNNTEIINEIVEFFVRDNYWSYV